MLTMQSWDSPTELLLDDLENLLLVELLWQALNSSQGFTTIALCGVVLR